jgi:hypothetical protein
MAKFQHCSMHQSKVAIIAAAYCSFGQFVRGPLLKHYFTFVTNASYGNLVLHVHGNNQGLPFNQKFQFEFLEISSGQSGKAFSGMSEKEYFSMYRLCMS